MGTDHGATLKHKPIGRQQKAEADHQSGRSAAGDGVQALESDQHEGLIGWFTRVMRANPLVQVPGDVLLIGRVLGFLSGIGKQLGSEVDIGATLFPYLATPSATVPGGV